LEKVAAGESPLRFVMYSGHDTSLVSYLLGLNAAITKAPPFAANLVIELDDSD
jgi:hypothetical protein